MLGIHKRLQSLLEKLSLQIYKHAWPVLFVALLFAAASVVVTVQKFKVINNISQLLDENSPANRNYSQLQKEFGTDECYLVLIQSDQPDVNRKAADRVAETMRGMSPWIERVYGRIDFSKLQDRFLFLLPEPQLLEIEQELSANAKALQSNSVSLNLNAVLDQANKSFDERYLRNSKNWGEFVPFIDRFCGMLNTVADHVEGKKATPKTAAKGAGAKALDGISVADALAEREYISYQGGRTVLVVGVRGKLEEGTTSPYSTTVANLRNQLDQLGREFPSVRFRLTGEPVLNDDELVTSTRDTEWASAITLGLIAVLFICSYRNLWRPAYAGVALAVGMAWSFAFAMLSVGHFNIISFAVIPMVLGLGIDFGIQILGRYEEEIAMGHNVETALRVTLSNTGVAIITGGSTTAAAFFTICFNEFLGLRELGMIAGASMVLCLIANLTVLPAILVLRDTRISSVRRRGQAVSNTSSLQSVDEKLVSFPRTVLVLVALLTAVSVYGIFLVRFDYNLLHLQCQRLESVKTLHELFDASENSTIFASVITSDIDDARQLEKKIAALPSVSHIESITAMLPEDQAKKKPIIARIVKLARGIKVESDLSDRLDVKKAVRDLDLLVRQSEQAVEQARKYTAISSQARMAVDVFGKLLPPLKRAQAAMAGLSQEDLNDRLTRSQQAIFGPMKNNLAWLKKQKADRLIQPEDLPDDVTRRFLSPSGKVLLQVYSKGDVWEREPNAKFVNELRSVAPDATGTTVQNFEYIELLRTSFLEAALWAFLAIIVLISVHFQNVRHVCLVIFPLVLAVVWRTGLMGWIGLPFNPANIVTLPLIIGIDVAYGVYVVDRYREEGRVTLFSNSTGKAIILTGLTAFFGFVSLLVSNYEGMFSIGLLMSLGIAIGLVTTVVVLPQILILLDGKPSSVRPLNQ